jgi:stearoyl-CoA desaturase (delta-9 desaturase)
MPPSSKSGSVEVVEIENHASHVFQASKPRPPVTWGSFLGELNWVPAVGHTLSPIIAIIGAYFTKLRWQTALFAYFYY